MDEERLRRIKELAEETRKLPPEKWKEFLEQRVPSDPQLVQDVLAELERQPIPDDFLRTVSVDQPPEQSIGDRFRLGSRIGGGAMGDVYEAYDTLLGMPIALKALKPELGMSPRAKDRFIREVKVATSVAHRNVCRIHDIHVVKESSGDLHFSKDSLFLSMELLSGETLEARMRRGPIPIQEATQIVRQLATGLEAAHQRGVVHRDFKPANIFLETHEGKLRVVITDFGLAFSDIADETLTRDSLVGTPAYMAPEQFELGRVTSAADIWALGVIMYEMVCGGRPFDAKSFRELAYKIVHSIPEQPSIRCEGLPPAWQSAILKCLEKDPEHRYPSALDVLADIDAGHVASRPSQADVTTRSAEQLPSGVSVDPNRFRLSRKAVLIGCLLAVPLGIGGWSLHKRYAENTCISEARMSSSREAYDLFLNGVELFEKQRNPQELRKAIETLSAAVERDPRFPLAHAKLADARITLFRSSRDRKDLQQAEYSANQAVKLGGCLPEAHYSLGSVLTDLERYDESQRELERGIARAETPLNSEGYRRLGRLFEERADKTRALQAYERAVQLNSSSFVNNQVLARAYFIYGMTEQAVKAYTKVVELAPSRPEGHQGLGLSLLNLGRIQEALPPLQKATSLQRIATNLQALASVQFYLRQYAESAKNFAEAAQIRSQSHLIQTNLATSLQFAGDKAGAKEHFEIAMGLAHEELEKSPGSIPAMESLAMAYARLGRISEAQQTVQKARTARPELANLSYIAASIAAISGSVNESLDRLEDALEKGHPVHLVPYDPDFDIIRSTPRYQDLLKRFSTK